MQNTGEYVFENIKILEKSYELISAFYSSKEFSRRKNSDDPQDALRILENLFFENKVSRLLIEIAASIRVMSDQMRLLTDTHETKIKYSELLVEVDKYEFGLFDDLNLTLREACNKIIHSEVFQIQSKEGIEPHESDIAYSEGMGDRNVKWRHVTNYVRLSGRMYKKNWHVLLDVEIFVSAIVKLLS